MEQKLYSEILKNYENLFKSKKDYDVIIEVGEEQSLKEIYAHSAVLRCQSNYFDAALSANWAERKDGTYIFKKPNISPHIFEIILRYLYCGKIDLNVKDGSDILKLLIAADELGLHTLGEYIQEFLISNQEEFLKNGPIEILEIIFRHEALTTLKNHYLKVICQEPDILLGADKISTLPAQILESLLLREDLTLNEIEVWDDLIVWTHAQQPTVSKDPSEWTKDELTLMERTISKFIPLIRFHDITAKEYYNKVLPYQYLLPEKLKQEILRFHLISDIKQIGSLPSRSFSSYSNDSDIINTKHLALLASWIDRKDKVLKRSSHKFNLILRGSRDGFDPTTFHTKCDNRGATIVIAKIKGTNQVVGGYNPLNWNGSGFKRTRDSFIYSFENYREINTGKIGRVIKTEHAIVCNDSWGPLFGNYDHGSNDLTMTSGGVWSSVTNAYSSIDIPRYFEICDYEVFQVVKIDELFI